MKKELKGKERKVINTCSTCYFLKKKYDYTFMTYNYTCLHNLSEIFRKVLDDKT